MKNNKKPYSKSSSKDSQSRFAKSKTAAVNSSGGRLQSMGARSPGAMLQPKGPKGTRAVVGTHAINEVLKVRPKSVVEAWFIKGWEAHQDLRDLFEALKKYKVTPQPKSESNLAHICFSHQNAVLFVSDNLEIQLEKIVQKDKSIIVFLDGVEDPHNLGAILRTSWLTGVDGVYAPDDRAVGLTATVHKVACGGVEHVPFTRKNQFSQSVNDLKEAGYWVFGLSHRAEKSIYDLKLPEKVVWMIGAEDKGLRTSSEKLCDELVYIPQTSASASYNASVAAAIALAETMRTHLLPTK